MKTFQEHIREMTDDALLDSLLTCNPAILRDLKIEWNRRHPEDPVPLDSQSPQRAT